MKLYYRYCKYFEDEDMVYYDLEDLDYVVCLKDELGCQFDAHMFY